MNLTLLILLAILYASLLSVIMSDVLNYNEITHLSLATATHFQLQKNSTHAVTKTSLYSAKRNQTTWWEPLLQVWQPLHHVLPQPLLQFAVSGGVAGFGLFIANVALDRHRRPTLSVDEMNSPKVVKIDLVVYKIDEKLIPYHLRQFTIQYKVNRILIRNEGRSAAKNSKGVLKVDDIEYRVCWSVPTERSVATINAHSMEYLELSAGLIGTQEEHYNKFRDRVKELQNYMGYIKYVTLREILEQEVSAINDVFKSKNDIPLIIAPTENGWQSPPSSNHVLLEGNDSNSKEKNFAIIVTTENSKRLEEIVNIQKPDNKGKIVEFSS